MAWLSLMGGAVATRELALQLMRGIWAMHAEPGELTGQTNSKAPIVTGTPSIFSSARLVSTDLKESGLWLWQGEVLPPPAPLRPKCRDQPFLRLIVPAAGWAGWIGVPAGVVLALLTVSMMLRPDRPVSPDRPAVTLSSAPSPGVTRPIVPVPSAERTEAELDEVQVPSDPRAVEIPAQEPEPLVAKGRAQHKSARTARKTHASHVHKRPLFPMPGMLTPPPMPWHGGGY